MAREAKMLAHERLTRHTYASVMLQKGNPLAYVSAQLGHSTPHTTLTYYVKYIPSQGGITLIDVNLSSALDGSELD